MHFRHVNFNSLKLLICKQMMMMLPEISAVKETRKHVIRNVGMPSFQVSHGFYFSKLMLLMLTKSSWPM